MKDKDTAMAIIINDYQPSGKVVEIQLPGLKDREKVPYADDIVTIEVQDKFTHGDYSPITEHFSDAGIVAFKKLLKPQLEDFITQWMGAKPGN